MMPTAMEQRLDKIVHELNEIKKEMIRQKVQPAVSTVRRPSRERVKLSKADVGFERARLALLRAITRMNVATKG